MVEFLSVPDIHTALTEMIVKIEDDIRRITGIQEKTIQDKRRSV